MMKIPSWSKTLSNLFPDEDKTVTCIAPFANSRASWLFNAFTNASGSRKDSLTDLMTSACQADALVLFSRSIWGGNESGKLGLAVHHGGQGSARAIAGEERDSLTAKRAVLPA